MVMVMPMMMIIILLNLIGRRNDTNTRCLSPPLQGVNIGGKSITNLRLSDDTSLMAKLEGKPAINCHTGRHRKSPVARLKNAGLSIYSREPMFESSSFLYRKLGVLR